MSSVSVATLRQEIRIALDQNKRDSALILANDIDTLALNDIIDSKIPEAARIVELNAPNRLLGAGDTLTGTIQWSGSASTYCSGTISTPNDFLRLVRFQMSDWKKPIFYPIYEDSPLYLAQSSDFLGVKGNPEKPIVAIVDGGSKIEFYSSKRGATTSSDPVIRAYYIKMPVFTTGVNPSINICDLLKPAIVYYAASLVAQELKDTDLATLLLNTSNTLMK